MGQSDAPSLYARHTEPLLGSPHVAAHYLDLGWRAPYLAGRSRTLSSNSTKMKPSIGCARHSTFSAKYVDRWWPRCTYVSGHLPCDSLCGLPNRVTCRVR